MEEEAQLSALQASAPEITMPTPMPEVADEFHALMLDDGTLLGTPEVAEKWPILMGTPDVADKLHPLVGAAEVADKLPRVMGAPEAADEVPPVPLLKGSPEIVDNLPDIPPAVTATTTA